MFDFGFWEIAIVGIITLIVVGPEKMPSLARKAGLYFGKLNRFFNKVKSDINEELRMDEIKEQMSMDEEKIIISEVTEDIQSSVDSLREENILSDKKTKQPMTDQKHSMEKLPLVQHLIELRRSLLRSVIAITIFFVVLFPFADEIYNFIADPIVQAIPGSNLIAIGVISPFLTPLKMSLILAIYIAMPYLLYQLWMFVAPALYRHEKRLVLPLVVSSTLLFYAGIVFSFYIVFPVIFGFLAGVGPDSVNFAPDIQYYLDFILKVSFAFGVAFEVPVVTILLIIFGVTTPQKLKKNRSYIIIGSFVIGMILTPPDVISQFLIAIPIWLLFEGGLIFSSFFKVRENGKQRDSNSSENDWTSKSHNDMMDKVEQEMNDNVKNNELKK